MEPHEDVLTTNDTSPSSLLSIPDPSSTLASSSCIDDINNPSFPPSTQQLPSEPLSQGQLDKLNSLKQLKVKSTQLEKIKYQISHARKTIANEDELIGEYQRERDQLLAEKQEKLNELRGIQKDIEAVFIIENHHL